MTRYKNEELNKKKDESTTIYKKEWNYVSQPWSPPFFFVSIFGIFPTRVELNMNHS